ncbi:hypothetical protein DICPUDRAFT_58751 [Dictyostelium purpureum]|uniref:nitric oxide dioxygenase n=1 Tax=Dictyostelium purpureum TaxID=5786 RepID=F1A2R8_DICPU|nr:uncharacterized protein DICPUDRAFT_58751 [Dictyostelium purpureum]EGC29514.1 hypothetical protein DICPUDRAFT_58751 [Dictyostelium purpureum]|eukprot:XP_003293958.1 hypothetical protein DICPUDRAFT_58751 [Dictyostelium purpureum]
MLSPKTVQVIKSTVPVLEQYGVQITSTFYKNMFAAHPELLNIFNHSNQREGKQQTALANTVYAAALHIDKLPEILPAVKQIAHKHRALGIVPAQYDIVGANLLGAIKQVLGDAATDEIIGAWAEAYGVIAKVFIDIEADMYKDAETQPGGWKDTREFTVEKKVQETPNIYSFYLKPTDGQPIASFQPGQYLTLKVQIGDRTHFRHYSLSDGDNQNGYRISVKKEKGEVDGVISNHLHDTINIGDKVFCTAPAGDFVIDQTKEDSVLFLCGGVGITPLLSMLKNTINKQPNRKSTFVFSSKNQEFQPFKDELKEIKAKNNEALHLDIIHSDTQGHVTKESLAKLTAHIDDASKKTTDVYICGPVGFMHSMNTIAKELGFEKIHYEVFGPLTKI